MFYYQCKNQCTSTKFTNFCSYLNMEGANKSEDEHDYETIDSNNTWKWLKHLFHLCIGPLV